MPSRPSKKPYVIPLFIPHAGCPHRCIFCDQTRTTGCTDTIPTVDRLHETVDRFLGYRRDPGRRTEIAFYGGTFLGIHPEQIKRLLDLGAGYVSRQAVQGLRFSTRPDTITPRTLSLISDFPVTTVELGVQSMDDEVLELCRRGHTADDTRRAVEMLRPTPYELGLQMMVGLPGDSPKQAEETARQIASLAPDFVRIYPTLVLSGSPLARWHARGRYTPMSLNESVELVKTLLAYFIRKGIRVIRMGLQPTADLDPGVGVLAGPFHPAFGELVHSALWYTAVEQFLSARGSTGKAIEITLHPTLLSRLKGEKNQNFKALGRRFALAGIQTRMAPDLPPDMILINGDPCHLLTRDEFI